MGVLACAAALAQTAPAAEPAAPAAQYRSVFDDPAPQQGVPPPVVVVAHSPGTAPVKVLPAPVPASVPEADGVPDNRNRQSFDPAPYVLTDGGRSVVLGRYSTSSSDPPEDLIEPIDAVVSLTYPRQTVRSIRDAIAFTLLRSGYSFDDSAVSDAGQQFLALPLPESQRQIGPYSVFTILNVLAGSAWRAEVNRVNRTVSIGLMPVYADSVAPAAGVTVPPKAAAPGQAVKPGRSSVASAAAPRTPRAGDLTP